MQTYAFIYLFLTRPCQLKMIMYRIVSLVLLYHCIMIALPPSHTHRVILMVATDGEGLSGPPHTSLLEFDRTCSVWRNQGGNMGRVLHVPRDLPDYARLGLCTSVEIERLEIMESDDITSLDFMQNITVS